MKRTQRSTRAAVLDTVARRLTLIDAAGCRGLERELTPDDAFEAIVDAVAGAQREIASLGDTSAPTRATSRGSRN